MDIAPEIVDGVAVVTVPVEELDASNAPEFKRAMAPVLEANAKVVLDLSRLRFIDSSGLGTFLTFLRAVNAKGGDLKLCRMTRPVRTMFELVRMHRMLDIFETQDEAVRAFAASTPESDVNG